MGGGADEASAKGAKSIPIKDAAKEPEAVRHTGNKGKRAASAG